MRRVYSLYEAKAKFSEILRKVREGSTVAVSYHGKPVAEIRPIGKGQDDLPERLRLLAGRGALAPPAKRSGSLGTVVRKPGALGRFFRDRNA